MKEVKQYFEKHPKVSDVYLTADGFLFNNKISAQKHANTLKNKEVQRFVNDNIPVDTTPAKAYLATQPELKGVWVTTNKELFTCEDAAKSIDPQAVYVVINREDVSTSVNDQNGQDESQEALLELLEKTELVNKNYKVLKQLVIALKLEVKDQRSITLIKALTEFKSTLKQV